MTEKTEISRNGSCNSLLMPVYYRIVRKSPSGIGSADPNKKIMKGKK